MNEESAFALHCCIASCINVNAYVMQVAPILVTLRDLCDKNRAASFVESKERE